MICVTAMKLGSCWAKVLEHREASQATYLSHLVQIMGLRTSDKILYPWKEKQINNMTEWSCANVSRNRAKTICNPKGVGGESLLRQRRTR